MSQISTSMARLLDWVESERSMQTCTWHRGAMAKLRWSSGTVYVVFTTSSLITLEPKLLLVMLYVLLEFYPLQPYVLATDCASTGDTASDATQHATHLTKPRPGLCPAG